MPTMAMGCWYFDCDEFPGGDPYCTEAKPCSSPSSIIMGVERPGLVAGEEPPDEELDRVAGAIVIVSDLACRLLPEPARFSFFGACRGPD